jgi:hypothetical protein
VWQKFPVMTSRVPPPTGSGHSDGSGILSQQL